MTTEYRLAVAREFGAPEVIHLENQPYPEVPEGAVLVAVRTSSVNPIDARRRSGGFGGPPPLVFGGEFAGYVLESKDPAWSTGQEVVGFGVLGAHADLVLTDGARLVAKAPGLGWDLAGSFGAVGRTAATALDAVDIQEGDVLVVHGAAGGVGTVLVQLAVARGITVIGTASEVNHVRLRELGARPVSYGEGVAERVAAAADGQRINASIDLAGTPEAGAIAVDIKQTGGSAITLVPETTQSHGIQMVQSRSSVQLTEQLQEAFVNGVLTLPVDSLPFTEIVEAHRRLDARHSRGKLVLEFLDNPHLTPFIQAD